MIKFKKYIPSKVKHFIKSKLGIANRKADRGDYFHLKKIARYEKTKVLLNGVQITIADSASFLFMHKEIFDQQIYKFKTNNPNPYIIDGGANIGLATIFFKQLYPNSEIIAFEPDAALVDVLESNVKSFGFRDVAIIPKGLWDKNEKLKFKSDGADAGILENLNSNGTPTSVVEVTSLKPFLNKKVDFLKLDIEGAETIVLRDIADALIHVERIFVEYHSFEGQKQTLNEIIDILSKAHFRLYMSIPGNNALKSPFMGLVKYNDMDFQLNIFGFKDNTNG
ncbi:MAG TPA: FkbM family methyltransferase [Flavobacteriaceae bacterium]|nr:FkbM family methyltransferase [Flavobacteriaceae bacterium]HPF12449.1 FkbM family methyltransferase [Flavobacteriaceae bacterium]HQU66207.1 FkbM family methyltransferase [Flavobacteriaceae bacterium]